MLRPRRR